VVFVVSLDGLVFFARVGCCPSPRLLVFPWRRKCALAVVLLFFFFGEEEGMKMLCVPVKKGSENTPLSAALVIQSLSFHFVAHHQCPLFD